MSKKSHHQIQPGDTVRGHDGGWWTVTDVERAADGHTSMDAVGSDGRPGYLSGPDDEYRDVR